MTDKHDRPLHICRDCGKPIWLSFVQRGDGHVHAECEIERLTKQRDLLLGAARDAAGGILVLLCGAKPTPNLARIFTHLEDAIAACDEGKP